MKDTTIRRTENIQRYFNDIKNPKYNPIKDDNIMRAMFRDGRENFRDIIINSNIRLVATLAKEYDNNEKFMDYNQVGIEGLVEAFEKYDPNQTAKFSTYASYWIKAKMSMLCKELNMIQKSNQGKIGSKAKKFQEQFYAQNMREATPSEIAEHLSTNCNIDIKNYDDVMSITITSINKEYDDDITVGDCGEFATKTSSNNAYEDKIEQEELSDSIVKMMRVLSVREKDYVIRHICNGETFADIAEGAGCTIERVRQIIVGGLKKMRDCEFAKTHFACFLK